MLQQRQGISTGLASSVSDQCCVHLQHASGSRCSATVQRRGSQRPKCHHWCALFNALGVLSSRQLGNGCCSLGGAFELAPIVYCVRLNRDTATQRLGHTSLQRLRHTSACSLQLLRHTSACSLQRLRQTSACSLQRLRQTSACSLQRLRHTSACSLQLLRQTSACRRGGQPGGCKGPFHCPRCHLQGAGLWSGVWLARVL